MDSRQCVIREIVVKLRLVNKNYNISNLKTWIFSVNFVESI